MKKLVLQGITIFSMENETAKFVPFDKRLTVITGVNQVGKSRIAKMIYWTLGGEVNFDARWRKAAPRAILEISISGQELLFYRSGRAITVIDKKINSVLISANSLTIELSSFLAKLFDFSLELTSSVGESAVSPTPAFIYLPFYLDQDHGWEKLWTSFEKLGQFKNWKKDLAAYHLGIRGKEYYAKRHESSRLHERLLEIEHEIIRLGELIKKLQLERKFSPLVFDFKEFSKEVEQLTVELYKINKEAEKYKTVLAQLFSERLEIENQLSVTQAATKELHCDYIQVLEMPKSVNCPICGQEYHQNILERFSIKKDEKNCLAILEELRSELSNKQVEINNHEKQLVSLALDAEKLNKILNAKKDNFSLHDMIESRSEQRMITVVHNALSDSVSLQKDLLYQKMLLAKELKKFSDPDRIQTIQNYLVSQIEANYRYMQVNPPEKSDYRSGLLKINCDGNERPRAVLGAFFGYIAAITKFGDSRLVPIVVDSPLQQDPDPINTNKILGFLLEKNDIQNQMIIVTGSTYDFNFQGKHIHIDGDRYSLLNKEDYFKQREIIAYAMNKAHELGF